MRRMPPFGPRWWWWWWRRGPGWMGRCVGVGVGVDGPLEGYWSDGRTGMGRCVGPRGHWSERRAGVPLFRPGRVLAQISANLISKIPDTWAIAYGTNMICVPRSAATLAKPWMRALFERVLHRPAISATLDAINRAWVCPSELSPRMCGRGAGHGRGRRICPRRTRGFPWAPHRQALFSDHERAENKRMLRR